LYLDRLKLTDRIAANLMTGSIVVADGGYTCW
jgi:hypothetical protein